MLAYAAQGLTGDAGSQSGGQLRELILKAQPPSSPPSSSSTNP